MPNATNIVRRFFPKVNSVEDAKKNITIEVTSHDNKSAQKKNHKSCAMAVACKRDLAADGVIVSVATAYVIKGTRALRYKVPTSTAREVVSFDRNGGFAPGRYSLAAPAPSSRLGGSQQKGSQKHTGNGKKLKRRVTANIRTVLGSAA